MASAIYEMFPPGTRRELHRRLATVVIDQEERVRHLAAASTGPDQRIAEELEVAAGRAAEIGAQHAAIELFAIACRLAPPRSESVDGSSSRGQGTSRRSWPRSSPPEGVSVFCTTLIAQVAERGYHQFDRARERWAAAS